MTSILNDLIRHIERTTHPIRTTNLIIETLADDDYEANRLLINDLLYYKYDLCGM